MELHKNHPITENELLKNFEKYRKIVRELDSLYRVPPVESIGEPEETSYVSVPIFSYRVNTSK